MMGHKIYVMEEYSKLSRSYLCFLFLSGALVTLCRRAEKDNTHVYQYALLTRIKTRVVFSGSFYIERRLYEHRLRIFPGLVLLAPDSYESYSCSIA